MKTNRFTLLLALCAVLFGCGGCIICGCVLIKPYLNFRNSTGQTIAILQKGPIPAFEIAPHKSAKVPFGERTNLTVTVRDRGTYEFERVDIISSDITEPYYDARKHSFLGLSSQVEYDLNLLLTTNLELYVLLPGKTNIDPSIPQPAGYPKTARKISD